MKKSLFILSVLAVFAITGCKNGGGGSSDPEQIVNEVNQAIENSKNYHGSMTVTSQSFIGDGLENEKSTFNAETKEYAYETNRRFSVCVPEENPDNDPTKENISKVYRLDKQTPADSFYAIASSSYADDAATSMFENEMVYQAVLAFSVASEAALVGGKDYFKTFMVYEMNDGMLESMGMHVDKDEATSSFETGVKEDGTKTASYVIKGVGKAMNGEEYPKMDIDYSFTLEYTDKVTLIQQNADMTYYLSSVLKQQSSMVISENISYEFDQAFYATGKAQTSSITKQYAYDSGYYKNYLHFWINGVNQGFYSDFVPNEELTTTSVLAKIDTHNHMLNDMDVIGVYTDEACTAAFTDRKSVQHTEEVYVKATPKEGKASIITTVVENSIKGDLPFTDEEFEFFEQMMGEDETEQHLYVFPANSDFNVVGVLKSDNKKALQSMTLNGEAFTANVIAKEYFAEHKESVMTLNYDRLSQSGVAPLMLSSRVVSNNNSGLMFLGPNNTNTEYYKLNTSDLAKANPTFAVKAYQSNKLLANGEALPTGAVELGASAITIKYYVGDSETAVTSLPAGYTGEFTIQAELTSPLAFIYLVIE